MQVLHLYNDIMNLYGEYANLTALGRFLAHNGERMALEYATFGDNVRLYDYDFIYMGSGTERNQKLVLADFARYSDELAAYIESGKPALFTGNAFEILGKSITDADGKKYDGLGIFDFETVEQRKTRMTADAIFEADFLDKPLVGFVNKCSTIKGVETPAFKVRMGLGNDDGKFEGLRKNNFIGTHLTGPIMVKNPHFLKYEASLESGRKDLSDDFLVYEKKGFEITLSELKARNN